MNDSEIITTIQLCKTFEMGEQIVPVLRNINISIQAGEFLSIMGPSGSGKSTLLYLMGGLDTPTSGTIYINGNNLAVMKDAATSILRRRELGFIFQFYNLIPNLNVEENILLPLMLDGKKAKDYRMKVDEILSLVKLEDRRGHKPFELSGGQQQRVAISRALIYSPTVILADEPTGNLDSENGKEVIELLCRINREQGTTIVMVTHSREAAAKAGRVVEVMDGEIL